MGELVTVDLDDGDRHDHDGLAAQPQRTVRQLLAELHACLDAAETADARAIVLRHEGPAFCAGADLKERSDGPPDATPFVSVLERLMDTERPTIAAVDGAVRAGGIGLMASCDLVVVNSDDSFALTEVRIGVAAAIISVPILLRVPAGKIAAAMLTGEVFDAAEARSIGLVTHVSDDVADTVPRSSTASVPERLVPSARRRHCCAGCRRCPATTLSPRWRRCRTICSPDPTHRSACRHSATSNAPNGTDATPDAFPAGQAGAPTGASRSFPWWRTARATLDT